MKIEEYLRDSIQTAVSDLGICDDGDFRVELTKTKSREFGDVATNIAMQLAGITRKKPREIAELIMNSLKIDENIIRKMEIAGPGFINFHFNLGWIYAQLSEVLSKGKSYGQSDIGAGKRAQVEFVSANPTGPLTIGHGRQAVLGDTIANILSACGYEVSREYYFNNAGNQMRVLGESVRLRYLELLGEEVQFADDLYQGEYIRNIAEHLVKDNGDSLKDNPEDPVFKKTAENLIFEDIKTTLSRLNIKFDSFYNENSLYEEGKIDDVIATFKERDLAYEKDGALWFKSTEFGLEQDRVIVKSSREPTYRLPDIAYHRTKFDRGFDLIIDIFGADHIATYPDVLAGLQALGYDTNSVTVLIHQFVTLTEGNEKVKMSTRKANFVTLDDLMDKVGEDVTRYFFLMRGMNTHLNFDLTQATTTSEENPVYYLQYAYARICNIEKFAANRGVDLVRNVDLSLLAEDIELELIRMMIGYPSTVLKLHESLEPQILAQYLTDLASLFHRFYFEFRVVTDQIELSQARLALVAAVKYVMSNGLKVLGISRPEQM